MDPNEVLRLFREATRKADASTDGETQLHHLIDANCHAENLFDWLANGGFAPDWSRES